MPQMLTCPHMWVSDAFAGETITPSPTYHLSPVTYHGPPQPTLSTPRNNPAQPLVSKTATCHFSCCHDEQARWHGCCRWEACPSLRRWHGFPNRMPRCKQQQWQRCYVGGIVGDHRKSRCGPHTATDVCRQMYPYPVLLRFVETQTRRF